MRNKKVLDILQALWCYRDPEYSDKEIREALNIAIKAVKKDAGCKYCKHKKLASYEPPCLYCYRKFSNAADKYEEGKE